MKAYEGGVPKEKIDAAAETFGMFMGPAEVADNVGLDVCQHVSEVLGYKEEQGPKAAKLIAQGKLGKKTGEGIYKWKNGKPVKAKRRYNKAELEKLGRELVAPLIAECEKCVAEGVVESADLADAGVIFGTGFAPFRGGPLAYSRSLQTDTASTASVDRVAAE
jgi:3-hydroxyacyl-CoA dehydrogenase/enoyl-CoA hydratase/3-hydroxybutyryl-CoA epimerase